MGSLVARQTVFERIEDQLDKWGECDDKLDPPAYVLYRGLGVTAIVDRYRKMLGQVVIYPREAGTPGRAAHMSNLTPSRFAQVGEVTRTIGQKMLEKTGADCRVMAHVEGHEVFDHPHVVMAPGFRGDSAALHEGRKGLAFAAELKHVHELFRLTSPEADQLTDRLGLMAGLGGPLNATHMPIADTMRTATLM